MKLVLESYETSMNGFLQWVRKSRTVVEEVYQNLRELITAYK